MLKNSTESFGSLTKAIHWIMAALIIVLIAVGLYMADLDKEDPSRLQLFAMHKSFGVLAMVLLVVRLVWLRISPAPALPDVFTAKEKGIVSGVKGILYLLMLLAPLSGYVMSCAAGKPIVFFGLFEVPRLIGESESLAHFAHEMHEMVGFAMIAFILLHLAGVIKHRLKDRNGPSDIMNRML